MSETEHQPLMLRTLTLMGKMSSVSRHERGCGQPVKHVDLEPSWRDSAKWEQ